MSYDIEFEVQLEEVQVSALRTEIQPLLVSYGSGLDGKRILTIIGVATAAQLQKVRAAVLRLFGEDQIGSLTIKHGGSEVIIESVHRRDVASVKDAALEILQALEKKG